MMYDPWRERKERERVPQNENCRLFLSSLFFSIFFTASRCARVPVRVCARAPAEVITNFTGSSCSPAKADENGIGRNEFGLENWNDSVYLKKPRGPDGIERKSHSHHFY